MSISISIISHKNRIRTTVPHNPLNKYDNAQFGRPIIINKCVCYMVIMVMVTTYHDIVQITGITRF